MSKLTVIAAVVAEIRAFGTEPVVQRGGKHYKASFWLSGKKFTYTVPCTASDHRTLLNCRAGVRRMIRRALEENDLPSRP